MSPDQADNKCSELQKKGYSFENAATGPLTHYDDVDLDDFECKDEDDDDKKLTKRTYVCASYLDRKSFLETC